MSTDCVELRINEFNPKWCALAAIHWSGSFVPECSSRINVYFFVFLIGLCIVFSCASCIKPVKGMSDMPACGSLHVAYPVPLLI